MAPVACGVVGQGRLGQGGEVFFKSLLGLGIGLHNGRKLCLLLHRQARPAAAARPVMETGEAFGIVAMHPVAQALSIHAAGGRRRAA